MKKYLSKILSIKVLSLFIISSCDSIGSEPTGYVNPEITFYSSGTWSAPKHLEITQDKRAMLLSTYPDLELKLTDEQYLEIVEKLDGLSNISVSDEVICLDTTVYTISIVENGTKNEVSFDGCFLGSESTAKPKVKEILSNIVTSLDQLSDSVYQIKAPWRGLEAEFTLDKETYKIGEMIEAQYTIHNPTDKVRELWFEHEYPFYFGANPFDYDGEYFHYDYPTRNQIRESVPTKITLGSGETLNFKYSWNQTGQDGENQVPVSEYMIKLGLNIHDFGNNRTVIRIVDQ